MARDLEARPHPCSTLFGLLCTLTPWGCHVVAALTVTRQSDRMTLNPDFTFKLWHLLWCLCDLNLNLSFLTCKMRTIIVSCAYNSRKKITWNNVHNVFSPDLMVKNPWVLVIIVIVVPNPVFSGVVTHQIWQTGRFFLLSFDFRLFPSRFDPLYTWFDSSLCPSLGGFPAASVLSLCVPGWGPILPVLRGGKGQDSAYAPLMAEQQGDSRIASGLLGRMPFSGCLKSLPGTTSLPNHSPWQVLPGRMLLAL